MFADIFVKGFVILNLFFSLFCKSSIDRIRALKVFLKSTVLSHLLPMHPFSAPWKHQKISRFSDVFRIRERVHGKQMS